MKYHITRTAACLALMSVFSATQASNIELFYETFDGITTGYSGLDPQQFGVPTTGGGTTANGGADEDWYGARFEYPGGGTIAQDVGVQAIGGGGNNTPVGLAEDDAGLMFKLDTTGLENIQLTFDWRTFAVTTGDRFIMGYFVGDLDGAAGGFAADRTIDLRNDVNLNGDIGPGDGIWNWSSDNNGGNTGDWIELVRDTSPNAWQSPTFDLTLASNTSEVWVAFWLDNGENDFLKIDNIKVTADYSAVVPVPAAVWLFGSGLLGLVGVARRKTS